ncbi:MAG: hypothetical protein ACE5MB_06770 [Anaerolineae bacterium]
MEQIGGLTAEMYRAVVAIVDERVKEIRVTREDFNALRDAVLELAQAQARTEARLEELAQAQARTEAHLEELAQAQTELAEAQARTEAQMKELAQAQTRTEEALHQLARQVGTLGENIGFGLEDIARVVLPGYLERHYGLKLEGPLGAELGRKIFDVEGYWVELNLYGEGVRDGRKVIVLGEAKSRIHGREVEKFARDVALVEPLMKGEIMRVMFGFYIHPTAMEEAEKRQILLVASYQR